MVEMIEANWIAFALALVLGLLVAWWLFARGSKGVADRSRRPDVLDEGAPPAQRNQALIDAPSAAAGTTAGMAAGGIAPLDPAGTMAGIAEVIAVGARDEAAPVPDVPAPPSEATKADEGDDLRRIKGVGPKLVTMLHELGVTRFSQIAGWDEVEIDRIDAQLGPFAGRIRRDNWVEQAKLLQSGDTAAYEARFGKL